MKTACIQINSTDDMAANIARIRVLVAQAAGQGATLIGLPENAFLMEAPGGVRTFYTQGEHPGVRASAEMAREHGVWLLAGSVAVVASSFGVTEGSCVAAVDPLLKATDDKIKTYNRSLLFSPQGDIAAQYDKIHLFDVTLPNGEIYAESARMLHGGQAVVARITGKENASSSLSLGMTICYDVRFPQLYRALAKAGAQVIAVPSAFTQVTGEAHWHVLLRARAIETGCYIIAPAQTGTHPGGRKTYGHALIVSPWGEIIADAGTDEGIIIAELDMSKVAEARARIPALEHDREFQIK